MKLNTPITLKDISDIIDAEYSGDDNYLICGINEIHKVQEGDLTFVDHPKYYEKALKSAATTIIINKRVEDNYGKALIYSDDPFRDYVYLTKQFKPFEPCSKMISDSAKIGEGTIIQPGVFVGNNVVIGKNCIINSNVSIYDHCIIGDNVNLGSGTVIGADAFYYKKRPEMHDKMHSCGRVIIEDNVDIGANCCIDKGVSGDTIIGEGTKLDNLIQIGHDTVVGKRCLMASQVGIAGCVTIEDEVCIWGQAGIPQDITIGKGASIMAQAGVMKSVEGNKSYFGSPASEIRDKFKEIAAIRKLPKILEELSKKN